MSSSLIKAIPETTWINNSQYANPSDLSQLTAEQWVDSSGTLPEDNWSTKPGSPSAQKPYACLYDITDGHADNQILKRIPNYVPNNWGASFESKVTHSNSDIVSFWVSIGSYKFCYKLFKNCIAQDIANCVLDDLQKRNPQLPLPSFYLKRGQYILDDDDPIQLVESEIFHAFLYIVGGDKKKEKMKVKNNQKSNKKKKQQQQQLSVKFEPLAPRYAKKTPMTASLPALSPCAEKFAIACAKPFSVQARGACNPNGSERFTQKVTGFVRFQVTIGTNGVGFVLVSPCVANDCLTLWISNSLFTGTKAAPLSATNTAVTGVSGVNVSNLPYTSTQLTGSQELVQAQITGRIVAAGVRLTYTGQEQTMGGMVYTLHDPFHNNVSGMGVSDITLFRQSMRKAVNREQFEFSMYPLTNQEDNFPYQVGSPNGPQNATYVTYPFAINGDCSFYTAYNGTTNYTWSTGVTATYQGAPVGVAILTGTAGNIFEGELIEHIEYSGSLSQNMLSKAHSDIIGGQQVRVAVTQAEEMAGNSGNGTNDIMRYMGKALAEVLKETSRAFLSPRIKNNLRITDF